MFRVVTLNVRGLNPKKFDLISEFFSNMQLDFACIQETLISNATSQNALAKKWNVPSFWSPAVGRRGGVTVLCCSMRDKISVWQKDVGRCLLSLLISLNNICINLLNIYAPTNPTVRKIFFQSLTPFLFPRSRVVIAGDFNCYDSILDKVGSTSIDFHFSEFKSLNFLRDAWRLKHPREKQFTWFNSNLSIASRFDSFLISRFLCEQVTICQIYPSVCSDHDFMFLDLHLQEAFRHGPGVWKFTVLPRRKSLSFFSRFFYPKLKTVP